MTLRKYWLLWKDHEGLESYRDLLDARDREEAISAVCWDYANVGKADILEQVFELRDENVFTIDTDQVS